MEFRIFIWGLFLVFISREINAQCAPPVFTVPSTVCLQQTVSPEPAASYTGFEWDFCAGDLQQLPTPSLLVNSGGNGSPYKVEYIEADGNHYGFFLSRSAGKLIRLDFGNDVTSTPQIVDLGGLGINSTLWLSIEIVKENDVYYGFVIDFSNKIYRLNFGTSITAIPSAEVWYSNGLLSTPIDLVMAEDQTGKFAFVANLGNNKLVRINFGLTHTASSASTPIDEIEVSGSTALAGVSMIRECDVWYLVTSSLAGPISKIHFVDGLDDASPVVNALSITGTVPPSPGGVSVAFDNNQYYIFVVSQQAQSNLYRLDLGSSMTNNSPAGTNLEGGSILSDVFGFSMHKVKSKWLALASENGGARIFRISFPNACFSTTEFSTDPSPDLVASTAGNFSITLAVINGDGNKTTESKNITIGSNTAPDIDFTSVNNCVVHDINFTSQNNSGDILTYDWDFGDLTTHGSAIDPVHQYLNDDEYDVTLEVTAVNGCANTISKTLNIYPEPDAGFSIPTGVLCTNNEFIFLTNTADVYDGNLAYQWYVDNVAVSTSRDLQHNFLTSGPKTIKLEVSIPGCSDDESQITPSFEVGPIVDFSLSGQCEDGDVQFTSNVSEAISGYSWDFDDGGTSTAQHPSHQFAGSGEFTVSLIASTPQGCNNEKIETITIYSKPAVDFSADPPPSSCSGAVTAFIDSTPNPVDSNLLSWNWNFDDPGPQNISSLQDPPHVFANAGTFEVSLSVTTDAGCTSTLQKEITILQAPQVTINNSATCKSIPVNFTVSGSAVQSYYWEIGTSFYELPAPMHTFNNAGDHAVLLTVTGSNNCVSTINKTITVPEILVPDFSVTNHCVGNQAAFTDITSGTDPVATRTWTIEGQDAGSNPATEFSFLSVGNKEVRLRVTSQAGCIYTTTKNITVTLPPNAGFNATPASGAAPLNVQFTNASSGATFYTWTFGNGGATSNQVSPAHTFPEVGDHNVELIARNNEGCEDRISHVIIAQTAAPDVDLRIITVSENGDGSLKVIITVQNNGNTILENLPVQIDISGEVTLRETIDEPILPSTMYNLVLSYSITKANLKFLCAVALLEGDLAPEGNRICTEVGENGFIFTAYPNPVESELSIEWIGNKDQEVSIFMTDAFGKRILQSDVLSTEGLNHRTFNVADLRSGIYFLLISNGIVQKTQRIFISPKN